MNATRPDLHLVVPVYNEAENFPRFYESVRAHVTTPHDITVVYDRDDDTTVPVVLELGRIDPSVILLRNRSPGVLGALKTGLAAAPGGAVVVTMADGSDDHRCVEPHPPPEPLLGHGFDDEVGLIRGRQGRKHRERERQDNRTERETHAGIRLDRSDPFFHHIGHPRPPFAPFRATPALRRAPNPPTARKTLP